MRNLANYTLLQESELEDINAKGYLLQHKKTKARILAVSNADDNKVFTIGFRTPPEDSTGLPHILEHSVLCGSKQFPAKDPFIELAKGSMNTFLNAMTYPDKTVYPVASCNDKDFQNLMHVYMDAVFYTNIYEKEEIFRQEGWHYELDHPENDLEINGVVYNEMKGAFSSPDDVLNRVVLNSLFPDTCYANESGGDPEYIPDLKYSQFLDFHSKYYHPSNSFIYLYGNMDIEEKLNWMDEQYLSKYCEIPISSEIPLQKPFEKPVEWTSTYSISSNESVEDNTYLSYNTVIGTSLDKELYLAFQILDYALLSAPGAPLKQALIDEKIGKDVYASYDNGIRQPIFSIVAKNANEADKERFLSVIHTNLEKIVAEGIDEKALLAGINYFEFRFREADFGNYPKGLIYGLQMFDSWLYDDDQPFLHIKDTLSYFANMRKKVKSNYFEELITTYLLKNTHASVVIIRPEIGLTAKKDQELKEKLQQYKDRLEPYQIQELIEKTEGLLAYQEEPSKPEDLESIPVLKREDIRKEILPLSNVVHTLGETTLLHHKTFTNGIGYVSLLFNVKNISDELFPYLGLLKAVLGVIDTENYKYGELFNEINIHTGGIATGLDTYSDAEDYKQYKAFFEIKAKVLYNKLPFAFEMMEEILLRSNMNDEKRLYEIVAQLKSRLQTAMNSSGHTTAAIRALSYFSATASFKDATIGVRFYDLIHKIEQNFDVEKEMLIEKLKKLSVAIFRPENLLVSYTAEEDQYACMEKEVTKLKAKLHQEPLHIIPYTLKLEQLNEGLKTSSKVQYVARAGNFMEQGFSYTGALRILKVILSYDYLWQNIRVKGGAYGCMSSFNKFGEGYFASYRDPNLKETNQIYENTTSYIKNFSVNERDMNKYVIGTISDMDTPLTPSTEGERSLAAYLCNITEESLKKERNEVLGAGVNEIRALSDLVAAVLSQNNICVLGNENKIEQEKELFQTMKHLF